MVTQPTKVITGKVRFSYLHVWEPAAVDGSSSKKYSASIIIPKSDKKTIDAIQAAVDMAKAIGKDTKFGGKIPTSLKLPLRDGDVERPEDEAYANSYFVNASSMTQPGIVDRRRQVVISQDDVYSGCYGHASITFFPFNTNGNKGIACGLNHMMKTEDGEPLGGRSTAESDFEGLEVDPEDDFLG